MSDSLDFVPKAKFRKKKRVTENASQNWDQSDVICELEDAKRRGRLLCKRCHKHKEWRRLKLTYAVLSTCIQMVWSCPDCGNALLVQDVIERRHKKKKGKKKKKVTASP